MKRLLAAAALVALGTMGAHAQSFPNRPVTVLVPLAPGGSTDTIGRIMAEGIRHHLGQPVIVENAPGAGGSTGVIRTARSTPDGYLMQIGQWGTNVASGAVYDLPINLLTDLEPVALIATQPSMIVGRKDRAGAGGSTGVIRAARSTPDGYLMQIGQWGTNVASGAVYNLPIDLLTDLEPVALIATQPSMIIAKKISGQQSERADRLHQRESRQGHRR